MVQAISDPSTVREILQRHLDLDYELIKMSDSLEDIVKEYMIDNDIPILYSTESGDCCSCTVEDFMPCGECELDSCQVGWLKKCAPDPEHCAGCEDPDPGTLTCLSRTKPEEGAA